MKDFRTLWKGLRKIHRPYRWRTAVNILLGAVRIALSLTFVWSSKHLVDIATGVSASPIGPAIALLVGTLVLQIVLGIGFSWWSSYTAIRIQNGLRRNYFGSVMQSRWNGREAYLSGDTVNRLEEDVRVLSELISSRVPDILVTFLQLIASSVYLLTLTPSLLWVLLGLMIIGVLGSKLFYKQLRKLTADIRALESRIQQLIQENLQHRVLVLTLTGVGRVLSRMTRLQDEEVGLTVKRLNYNAVARGLMGFGFQAGYLAAFLWGIFGIRAGTVTYGMMTAFLQLVGQVQRPVAEIGRQIPSFIHALTSVERLMELEELPGDDDAAPITLEAAPEIVLSGVSFSYPGETVPVLEDFSCRFEAGGWTAVAGPTGVGKSTLVRLVLGLLSPDKGSVTVGGLPAGAALRENFLYVPQGNTLMSGTVRSNLLMADPSATEEQMEAALNDAAADFVLSLPEGLDTPCGEVGSGLSEGQAQRIAVARTLLKRGSVLILDEATSSLDADTELRMLQRLRSRCLGSHTVIFISHREAVLRLADVVVKL
ncbi:MAG: ABC transporter ATP-binding protein/permease [Bacteroidales bacterium]|nr:ABC transporter ATP-binding protein/permease [Bacteroidales bacterium]